MQYRKFQNRAFGWKESFENRTVAETCDMPILFAPGESCEYGLGIDCKYAREQKVLYSSKLLH